MKTQSNDGPLRHGGVRLWPHGSRHTLGRLHTDKRLVALYRLLDALVDTMYPYLTAMDERIDELQDQIFVNPRESQLAELFSLKRQLVNMRKLVTPQRDMVSAMMGQVVTIPGMTAESERYVRDLYDHLIRISDMVDSYRDLLSGSLDAYMSMVSNRLNDVMKQLTIIATVFLPLSFLTGFFGQNLGWLVDRIGSLTAFLAFGIGTELLAVICLLVLFRRRGWMGRGS
jgi:magnesium transporter